jgi:hypothetical protein
MRSVNVLVGVSIVFILFVFVVGYYLLRRFDLLKDARKLIAKKHAPVLTKPIPGSSSRQWEEYI